MRPFGAVDASAVRWMRPFGAVDASVRWMRTCDAVSVRAYLGGSKGIGLMIAAGFVQNGATVYIFSRKPDTAAADALDRQGAASGGKCYAMACDVSDHEQIKQVSAEIAKRERAVHVRQFAEQTRCPCPIPERVPRRIRKNDAAVDFRFSSITLAPYGPTPSIPRPRPASIN
jgi:hypothetical protein